MRSRRGVLIGISAVLGGCNYRSGSGDSAPSPTESESTPTLYLEPEDDVPDFLLRNRRDESVTVKIELVPDNHDEPTETLSWTLDPEERLLEDRLPAIRDGGTAHITVGSETETVSVPLLDSNRTINVLITDAEISAAFQVI